MPIENRRVQTLRLLGGVLCLDFVNTIEDRAGRHRDDRIISFADLIAWGAHSGVLTDPVAEQLLMLADDEPDKARAVHDSAIELRESLHRVFLAIAHDEEPPASDLDRVHHTYSEGIGQARLVPADGDYEWRWDESDPRRVLWMVAASAVDLLTNGDLHRVKVCANPGGCGWLFCDRSKNGSRRWCSMEGCGTRVKMRRYLSKRRT